MVAGVISALFAVTVAVIPVISDGLLVILMLKEKKKRKENIGNSFFFNF